MIEIIKKIAKDSGKIIMSYKKGELDIKNKTGPLDFVTKADIEADKFIQSELKKNFPKDLILSEENTNIPENYNGRVWMVDPLDGTRSFINGYDSFSVMIGLCVDGKPILGVVYAPARKELYFAQAGKGAYFEKDGKEKKLQVSNVEEITKAIMVTRIGKEPRIVDSIIEHLPVKEIIPESSVGLKLGMISKGKADMHINSNFKAHKWDTCAPQIILEESGGIVTDFYGKPLDYTQKSLQWKESFVASNYKLHLELLKYLKEKNKEIFK